MLHDGDAVEVDVYPPVATIQSYVQKLYVLLWIIVMLGHSYLYTASTVDSVVVVACAVLHGFCKGRCIDLTKPSS